MSTVGVNAYARQRPPLFTTEPVQKYEGDETQDVFIDGKHVGTYRVHFTGGDTANIGWVGILDPYRRHGYGRMVVEKILYDLKLAGIRKVYLASLVESVGFWEKMGFTPLAGFPRWHGDSIVWMEKTL